MTDTNEDRLKSYGGLESFKEKFNKGEPLLPSEQLALIQEVERLTKERDSLKNERDCWEQEAKIIGKKLEDYKTATAHIEKERDELKAVIEQHEYQIAQDKIEIEELKQKLAEAEKRVKEFQDADNERRRRFIRG